jgi:hypothetical protein
VALCVGAAPAVAQETNEELKAEIKALRERLNQVEARQNAAADATPAAAQSARVETSTRTEVVRDAEERSEILAGYEEGKFFLRSADDTFSLSPGAQLQIRYTVNSRDDVDDDLQDGFEMRRAKFNFGGHLVTKDFTYNLQWESNENGGGVTLEEAWVRYKFRDDMAVRLGQMKDNPFREETISSKRQLAVDRSLLNELIAGGETDYVQGVRLEWDVSEALRADVTLHDGYNSDNTPFAESGGTAAVGVGPTEWGVSGRLEFFAMGQDAKKQYDDFSAMKNKENLFVVGGGFDYSMAGNNHAFFHTVDAQYENTNGLGVYGAVVGLDRETSTGAFGPGSPETSLYDWGVLLQAGYMLNERYEVFGRWDVTFLDDAILAAGDEDTINEITLGVNRYFHGHSAKLTVDASYLPDGAPSNEAGIGVLASDEEQFVVRGQFQLLL